MTGTLAMCLALVLTVGCTQQQAGSSFDEQISIAQTGNDAVVALDWQKYAEVLHTEALDSFRVVLLQPLESFAQAAGATDSVNLFGRILNIQNLRAGDSEAFFVSLMTHLFATIPDLGTTFSGMDNRIVGAVADGDSLVHVVMQTKMGVSGRNVDEMNVLTLKRDQGDWKLLASNKIQGIMLLVRQNLLQRKP